VIVLRPLFLPVDEWLQAFTPPYDDQIRELLTRLYGTDKFVWQDRCKLFCEALGAYREHYGSGPVLLSRSPARLSFNPHSDHQGSFVLYGCHAREVVVVCGWRDDDVFRVANATPQFASGLTFTVEDEAARAPEAWQRGWLEYIERPAVKAAVADNKDPKTRVAGRTGTINYIKGAVLRLAHARPGEVTHGLNLLVAGDIHYGAGQSQCGRHRAGHELHLPSRLRAEGAGQPDRRGGVVCRHARRLG
jgi:hypothetical protein